MTTSPNDTARAFWGENMPDWIAVLADECTRTSQAAVARRLKRSASMISQVLRGSYAGHMDVIEDLVRGAFMAATIACPALGPIPTDQCRDWRKKSRRFSAVNPLRVRMFGACAQCPHNKTDHANA